MLWQVRQCGRGEEGLRRSHIAEALLSGISSHPLPPTPTQYYVAILSTLSTAILSKSTIIDDVLYVANKVVPFVPLAVARLDYDVALAAFVSGFQKSKTNQGLRSGLNVIGELLVAQSKDAWTRPVLTKAFKALLSRLADDNPKVRRAAQDAVQKVLAVQRQREECEAPSHIAWDTVQSTIDSAAASPKTSLRLLYFVRSVLCREALQSKQEKKRFPSLVDSFLKLYERSMEPDIAEQSLLTLEALAMSPASLADHSTQLGVLQRLVERRRSLRERPGSWGKVVATLSVLCEKRELGVKALTSMIVDQCVLVINVNPSQNEEVRMLGESLFRVVDDRENISKSTAHQILKSFSESVFDPIKQTSWVPIIPALTKLIVNEIEKSASSNDEEMNEDDVNEVWIEALGDVLTKANQCRESLVDWKTGEDKTDAQWRSVMESLVEACALGLGSEKYFEVLPLHLGDTMSINPARLWSVSVLSNAWKDPMGGKVKLTTFKSIVLKIAKFSEDAAAEAKTKNMLSMAKIHHARTILLWSMFPSFCAGACDASETFPTMAKMLFRAMTDPSIPELCPIICNGIVALIESCIGKSCETVDLLYESNKDDAKSRRTMQTKSVGAEDGEVDDDDDGSENFDDDGGGEHVVDELHRKPENMRARDEIAIRTFAPNFLPSLFNQYDAACRVEESSQQISSAIFNAVESFGRISDGAFLKTVFRQLVQKTLVAIQEEDAFTTRVLIALASALAPSLTDEDAPMLLRLVKPLINGESEVEDSIQKRAYVALIACIKSHPVWTNENRTELIELLQSSLSASASGSKRTRLRCLTHLIRGSAMKDDVIKFCSELLGEVVLSFKEANAQTRREAFRLFSAMAKTMDECDPNGSGLNEFFQMTIAGLAARTPHMRSATVVGITRLIAMFGPRADVAEMVSTVVKTCLMLFVEKSREVAKSCISLCKACAVRLDTDLLREVLPDILRGLLPWSLDTKNRFSVKIRVVLDRLVKRFGFEEIENLGVIPKDHRLLIYVKRMQANKKKSAATRKSEHNIDEEENDQQDARTQQTSKRDGSRKGGARKFEITQNGEDPIDLLDPSSLGNVARKRRREDDEEDEDDEKFPEDKDGRIIIPKEDRFESKKKRRAIRNDDDDDGDATMSEDDGDMQDTKSKATFKSQKSNKSSQKKRPEQSFGQEFKAKKAGGDAKYKGSKTDPYAYIPLNHTLLNRRKKHQAVKQFVGVGKGATKKGPRQKGASGRGRAGSSGA